jgi:hypothetical protein
MKVFDRRSKSSGMNRDLALACTPLKNTGISETRLANGDVLLLYPVRVRPWFSGLVRRLGVAGAGTMQKKLQLDRLGTDVWDRLDGQRTVGDLIRQFAEDHRLHAKEAEVAITRFLRELGRRGLVGLR